MPLSTRRSFTRRSRAACWAARLDGGPFQVAEFVAHDSRLQVSELESRPSRCRQCYEITFAFGGTADMVGLAAGSTQSRMTHLGLRA